MVTEIVNVSKSLSPEFYVTIFIAIVILALIVLLTRKLNYDFNKILKSIGISLLITVGIKIFLLIISFFLSQPMCKTIANGGRCPTNADILLASSLYTLPAIFLIVLLIYLIIKITKAK